MTSPTAPPEVIAALRTVADPCSLAMGAPIDVWDLGLVQEVEVTGGQVVIDLLLTDFSCSYFRDMRRHIVDALLALPGVEGAEVHLITAELWTPEHMRVSQVYGPAPPVTVRAGPAAGGR